MFVQDLAAAEAIKPVVTGFAAHFQADFAADRLIVLTDWQAPNGRIVEVDSGDPAPAHWREIVPSAADAIQSFALVGGKLIVRYLHNVTSRLALFSLDGKERGALPGPGTVSGIEGQSSEVFFDFTLPRATYRADLAGGAVERLPAANQAMDTRQRVEVPQLA